jgi:hypothetical protein
MLVCLEAGWTSDDAKNQGKRDVKLDPTWWFGLEDGKHTHHTQRTAKAQLQRYVVTFYPVTSTLQAYGSKDRGG